MELNGVNSSYASYASTSVNASSSRKSTSTSNGTTTTASTSASYSTAAATYEGSVSNTSSKVSSKADNSALIAQLKADSEKRTAQMQSLVTNMFQKQGISIGTADDMWKVLAGGNFTADAATISQAKDDISENGYWGVNQTSDRIFSFALALTGGDEEKMKTMVSAVEKGFSQATKTWGKDLPDITSDTHSSIMDKFDQWFKDKGSSATTSDILNS